LVNYDKVPKITHWFLILNILDSKCYRFGCPQITRGILQEGSLKIDEVVALDLEDTPVSYLALQVQTWRHDIK